MLRFKDTVLVFGGPYSNLRALKAVRARARALNIPPERVICTGDVVAYCAEPEETVAAIRAWGCHVIMGNCEEQLAAGLDDCGCGFGEGSACDVLSQRWYSYANGRVSSESRAWMAGLPRSLRFEIAGFSALVVHGGVSQINRFIFPRTDPAIKREEAHAAAADLVIAGHSGIPFIEQIALPDRTVTWFNPGVIGMPANDGTTDGWYGLIAPRDGQTLWLDTLRLPYYFRAAAKATRASGHANLYADALLTGLWPNGDILPEGDRARAGQWVSPLALKVERQRQPA